jgi:hypothetical protein
VEVPTGSSVLVVINDNVVVSRHGKHSIYIALSSSKVVVHPSKLVM